MATLNSHIPSGPLAQKWEIPALIVFSGNRNGLDDERGKDITAQGLQRVAKAAEDAGFLNPVMANEYTTAGLVQLLGNLVHL